MNSSNIVGTLFAGECTTYIIIESVVLVCDSKGSILLDVTSLDKNEQGQTWARAQFPTLQMMAFRYTPSLFIYGHMSFEWPISLYASEVYHNVETSNPLVLKDKTSAKPG